MPNDSNNTDFHKKKGFVSRGLALLLGSEAIFILWGVWTPVITKHKFEFLSDFSFLLFFKIPSSLLAIYFFNAARIIWQGMSTKGIRKLSVCLSLLLAALLLIFVSGITESFSKRDEIFWTKVTIPFIIIVAGRFYLYVKQWLFKCFSVTEVTNYTAHIRATKLYFAFLGFSIWFNIAVTTELLPKHADYEYLPANHWLGCLIVFGSIPLAICCYRIGLKLFLKRPPCVKHYGETTTELLDAGSGSA